ncbi:MAG: hypothetical protein M1282_07385 [Chloroflexi bacterium]|nr:hypothetical protein [Chloroflexota bacterium]
MKRRILIPSLIFLVALMFAASSAFASSSNVSSSLSSGPTLAPGNYCVSCHMADDPRLASVTEWKGGIAREVNSPCPAATVIHEQLYYTERMSLMIDRAEKSTGALSVKDQARLENYTELYSRQLDEPVTSLDAFTSKAQTARYRLNKIYTLLNQMAENAKQRTVLIYAGLITLIVLGSLAWGLYNTRAIRTGKLAKSWAAFWRALFVLAVAVFFVLPIFRAPAAEVATPTPEEQQTQTVLDTADRAATAADRAQARAWMLARLGVAWNKADPDQAQTILNEALSSAQQAQGNDDALWGQSLAVQEAAVGVSIDMEKASLIATDLNAARARSWSMPLIAVEWNTIEPARAIELLQTEQADLSLQAGIYRDFQLRGVALAWAKVEPRQAMPAAEAIQDPLIRSWTFREIGELTNNKPAFEQAAEAARQVADPVQRARALEETAASSGDKSLFDEASSALDDVTGAPLAYALSDLAAASGNESLVDRISPAYPDARTAALLYLGKYQAAWDASAGIADPYEQARARAAIAGAWGNADAAMQIEVPLYRDLALRDVIRKTGNAALADSIQSPYYKVQALTALGEYQAAAQAGDKLGDSYPLTELAAELAKNNPQMAAALVDKMTSETDKATALRAIAAASGDQTVFEQAQGMALAARASGDSLLPSEASLDLANLFWQINPFDAQSALRQAYEAAEIIPIK